jgi:DNA replication and repair protein RecF
MTLERLQVDNFRCIERADLEFDARCNLISGANASGKTSLLEALYFLGRARSFRTSRCEPLIRNGADRVSTVGRLNLGARRVNLVLANGRGGLDARIDGRPVTGVAELATALPVQAIDPEVHRLIEEGPQQRRRYLDWGVFHVEPSFVTHWQRFQRALRQRNAALRSRQAADLVRVWDADLIGAGARVADARLRYLEQLRPHVSRVGQRLLHHSVDLCLSQGWPADRSLADALDHSWNRDRDRGLTHAGPQRADLRVHVQDEPARDRVSRGQQKLVAAAMLLGQLRCDAELGSTTAALLVDDPAAELDSENLDRLLREVLDLPVQLFLTSLEHGNPALHQLHPAARFHVEHGVFTRLI